jgi:hypothetical protein
VLACPRLTAAGQVDTVAINASGDWLAFGSAKLGQLLVWEWQSETYVLKQQVSHHPDMIVQPGTTIVQHHLDIVQRCTASCNTAQTRATPSQHRATQDNRAQASG